MLEHHRTDDDILPSSHDRSEILGLASDDSCASPGHIGTPQEAGLRPVAPPPGDEAPAAQPAGKRDTARDGFRNRAELWVTTHLPRAWGAVQRVDLLRVRANRILINGAIERIPCRPNPLSTMVPYTSWPSLTDRTYYGRHLPPVAYGNDGLPDPEYVAERLFEREKDAPPMLCPKSTVTFAAFAQWFTEGFLRGKASPEPLDENAAARTESSHAIDLSQLYGLNQSVTRAIRGDDGLLKSQMLNGEEFPLHLCENGRIKPEFDRLPEPFGFEKLTSGEKDNLFAMGGDRSNGTLMLSMLNVLFLREHNRIARALARTCPRGAYPRWDDDRIFETTRNILTVLVIKIAMQEYINHITPYHFRFSFEPTSVRNEPWYRENWVTAEFDLLYRWHTLVPSKLRIAGQDLTIKETLFNSPLLIERGLGPAFEDLSKQRAGRIGLFNTDTFLLSRAEIPTIQRGRLLNLAPYNDYRELCKFPRVRAFERISGDPKVQSRLRELYGSVDRIEFYVGLFAEDLRPNSVLPALMGRMVGADAFSQALTNPLLSPHVYNENTFSAYGLQVIEQTHSLSDLVNRNVREGARPYFVSMTRHDWRRA